MSTGVESGSGWLVLLETSANQRYVFGSNRRRENAGASAVLARLVGDAVRKATAADETLRVLQSISGKAILIAADEAQGRAVVSTATRHALAQAPGVELRGVVVPIGPSLRAAVGQAHQALEQVRNDVPGPDSRYLRLPVVAPCATSGLPAMDDGRTGDQPDVVSAVTQAKRDAADAFDTSMKDLIKTYGGQSNLAAALFTDAGDFDRAADRDTEWSWTAVIHADGNRVGQTIMAFEGDDDAYAAWLTAFSAELDDVTHQAFAHAAGSMPKKSILPLILGGDDLTALCRGDRALAFTAAYLREFGRLASAAEHLKDADSRAITASAGVAIVKPHFPFHTAYELAAQLCAAAKRKHPGEAALDWHVLYDSSGGDLGTIRGRLPFELWRPYTLDGWDALAADGAALNATDTDGRRCLPRSQAHALREALYWPSKAAESALRAIRHRYVQVDWSRLLGGVDTAPSRPTPRWLDVLDAADFGGA